MAKYKQPKNEKHKARKDLKDYTGEGTNDCQWDAHGEVLPGPRKDDKFPNKDAKIYKHVANHKTSGDGPNMVVDLKDSDRIYPIKSMQDGDPKMRDHAKKTFEKNIEDDAKEFIETLAKRDGGYTSQIKKLTKEQKEKLVREVVRRKVLQFLSEQEDKEKETTDATDATGEPAETPAEPEAAPATPADPPTPTTTEPIAPATPAEPEPEAEPEAKSEPEPEAEPETKEDDPDGDGQPGDARISNFVKALEQKPNIVQQMKTIMSVINKITSDDDKKRKIGKLMLLKRAIDRAVAQIN